MITFNQGILFCIVQALLWSLLPVFVKLGFTTTSPLLSLAVINSFAFLAFGSLMGYKRRWGELTRTEVWPYIVTNAVLNGLIYYSMVFIGTKLSTAGNAAILLLLEAPFALLLLGTSGHDKVTGRDIIGTALTLLAAALVVWPEQWSWNAGDLLLILACIPPIFGNLCSRKARKSVSAVTIMFSRTVIITPCFWIAASLLEGPIDLTSITPALGVLFFNGFIVLGVSRLLWIEAIQIVPISKANSISSVSPIFTLIAAWAILNEIPTESQIFSLVPMFLGLQLLMKAK